jgi:hypothetical protein
MNEDDLDEELDEPTHPCPHCGSEAGRCDHQIVEVEWTDLSLCGLDFAVMERLNVRLVEVIVALADAGVLDEVVADSSVSRPLAAMFGHEDFESVLESDGIDWTGPTLHYWLEAAACQPGCTRESWEYLSDSPCGSGSYEAVYAKDGPAAFVGMIKNVEADLVALRARLG